MKKKLNFFIITFLIFFYQIAAKNNFAVISIPKCGTHLLLRTLNALSDFTVPYDFGPPGWCVLDDATIHKLVTQPYLLKTHAIYSEENIKQINRPDIKTCFIYRDPRDQLVSAAFWVKKNKKQWPKHSQWTLHTILDELIIGGGALWGNIFSSPQTWVSLQGIKDFYDLYLPWRFEPFIYTTTFEKLIGPKGGGTKEAQLQEIMAIAQHIGIEIDIDSAEKLAPKIFGQTITFREGKKGTWKRYFLPRHKEAFKKIAGEILIELGYENGFEW